MWRTRTVRTLGLVCVLSLVNWCYWRFASVYPAVLYSQAKTQERGILLVSTIQDRAYL